MRIIKQLDSSDLPDVPATVIGFVEAQDALRGWHLASYYTGSVYRQPVNLQKDAPAHLRHNHPSLDAAVACVTRLLRKAVA
jgi:hypothetical protein